MPAAVVEIAAAVVEIAAAVEADSAGKVVAAASRPLFKST